MYGFFFVLAMCCSMAVVAMLSWPRPLWIIFTVAWALLLISTAWWWTSAVPEKRGWRDDSSLWD